MKPSNTNNIKEFFIGKLTGSFDRPATTHLYDSITGESFFKVEYYQNGTIRIESSIIDIHDKRYNPVKGHIMASIPLWKEISLGPDVMYDYNQHIGHLIQSIEREDKLNQLFEEEEYTTPKYKHITRWI